jgi:2-oxoglutarate dehydrogenase E2 component (dihydrolipoamide succinyltransferase)
MSKSIEIRVPQLPESVSDATIASWLKQVGDDVQAEEPLLELETDKVVLEVPSPSDGVLTEITVEQGETVLENDLIALLNDRVSGTGKQTVDKNKRLDSATQVEPTASPSVRKSMLENNISMNDVHASGDKGRVLKSDVEAAVKAVAVQEKNPEKSRAGLDVVNNDDSQSQQINHEIQIEQTDSHSTPYSGRAERRVPMSRLRQRVAERLVEAQRSAAILTTFNEVDLSDLVRLRKTYQERFQHAHGIKLGFMSFFVKAATEALKRFPEVNAKIDNNDIIYHGYYDIGVAVSTERGLVVPIIRNTDQLGHADIEKAITDYAQRARDGKLEMDELVGGTFSISNGGVFGSMLSTPILNPPQSGILGMHKIEERAVVRKGEIVIRPMMYLALSYDHRLIDG